MVKRRQSYKKYKPKKKPVKTVQPAYTGYNGAKYDAEGKEQDFSDNEDVGDQMIFLKQYLHKMKNSSKVQKAKEYLTAFTKKNWKFNKNNQNLLIKLIIYEELFTKEYLTMFKEYMKNMHAETKKKLMKQLEELVESTKADLAGTKMSFKINGRDLKFSDLEHKEEFLTATHKRCVELIEQ